jgi:membrane protease YdiL (CAAX protease family)
MQTFVRASGAPPVVRRGGRLQRWAGQHPYAAINALVVTAGWSAIGGPILADRGVLPGGRLVDASPVDVEKTAALAGMAVLLAGALWVARLADGPARVALVRSRAVHWQIGLRSWAVAVAALPVTTVLVGVALGRPADLSPGALLEQIAAVAIAVAAINLVEETVWAGLVQTRLEVHRSLSRAAFLTAVPFALLHLPLRYVEADPTAVTVLGDLMALLVLGFVIRLLFGLALRRLDDSLLGVAVLHASFNSANNEQGIGASVLGADHQGFALLAVLVVLAGLVVAGRGGLGRRDAEAERVS